MTLKKQTKFNQINFPNKVIMKEPSTLESICSGLILLILMASVVYICWY